MLLLTGFSLHRTRSFIGFFLFFLSSSYSVWILKAFDHMHKHLLTSRGDAFLSEYEFNHFDMQKIMENISVGGEAGGAGGAYSCKFAMLSKDFNNIWSNICTQPTGIKVLPILINTCDESWSFQNILQVHILLLEGLLLFPLSSSSTSFST